MPRNPTERRVGKYRLGSGNVATTAEPGMLCGPLIGGYLAMAGEQGWDALASRRR
jgi:hypothetical protein